MSERENGGDGGLTGLGTPENGKSEYVKLNVGGALFQTTLTTLMKHDTMLRAMFSGRMELLKDDEGWVMIDRSGKHFGTILNFLRDGSVPLPECRSETLEILAEAKYYLIQDLIVLCNNWLNILRRNEDGPIGNFMVPVLSTRKSCDAVIASSSKPVIKLVMNRHNNKFSYIPHSEDNMLKNLELFERLLLRFANRVLFIKDVGVENAEICQWSFFGQGAKQAEICCTSIVYATDNKHTKVEFPEARILEEAMNILLFEERNVCSRCGREKGRYSPIGITAQLQLPPITYSNHISSASPQFTPSTISNESTPQSPAPTFDERRRPVDSLLLEKEPVITAKKPVFVVFERKIKSMNILIFSCIQYEVEEFGSINEKGYCKRQIRCVDEVANIAPNICLIHNSVIKGNVSQATNDRTKVHSIRRGITINKSVSIVQ